MPGYIESPFLLRYYEQLLRVFLIAQDVVIGHGGIFRQGEQEGSLVRQIEVRLEGGPVRKLQVLQMVKPVDMKVIQAFRPGGVKSGTKVDFISG